MGLLVSPLALLITCIVCQGLVCHAIRSSTAGFSTPVPEKNGDKNGPSDSETDQTLIILGVTLAIVAVLALLIGVAVYFVWRGLRRHRREYAHKAPSWISTIQREGGDERHGLDRSNCSEAVTIQGHVTAHPSACASRQGTGDTGIYAVRGKQGFTRGKHLWEVIWPPQARGQHASLGVGTNKTALSTENAFLLGNSAESWGFDLKRQALFHKTGIINFNYPPKKPSDYIVPARIFMYLDMDIGTLAFGTEGDYWGIAAKKVRTIYVPIYPLLAMSSTSGRVQIIYKGEARPDLMKLAEKSPRPTMLLRPSQRSVHNNNQSPTHAVEISKNNEEGIENGTEGKYTPVPTTITPTEHAYRNFAFLKTPVDETKGADLSDGGLEVSHITLKEEKDKEAQCREFFSRPVIPDLHYM